MSAGGGGVGVGPYLKPWFEDIKSPSLGLY